MPDAPKVGPRPKSPLARASRGFLLPLEALGLLARSRSLWPWALAPAAVTLVLLAVLSGALVLWGTRLTAWVWAPPEGWALQLAWWALYMVIFLGVLAVGVLVFPGLVSAPLLDVLSARTEAVVAGVPAQGADTGWLRGLWGSLTDEVAKLVLLLAGHGVLLLLLLVPVAGPVAYPVLAGVWTVLWLAADHLQLSMARHGHRFATVRRTLQGDLAGALGLGGALFLLFAVPLVNLLVLPVAAVAGTLWHLRLRDAGRLPPVARAPDGAS